MQFAVMVKIHFIYCNMLVASMLGDLRPRRYNRRVGCEGMGDGGGTL